MKEELNNDKQYLTPFVHVDHSTTMLFVCVWVYFVLFTFTYVVEFLSVFVTTINHSRNHLSCVYHKLMYEWIIILLKKICFLSLSVLEHYKTLSHRRHCRNKQNIITKNTYNNILSQRTKFVHKTNVDSIDFNNNNCIAQSARCPLASTILQILKLIVMLFSLYILYAWAKLVCGL